ncbi:hypothetical protein IGI04_036628 [Brassica rapa subsp. trilocularis]|uniref:Phosphofructokinase domain-containing protein n=1 Tax=Brassica rapa subsp. trilocularis TaxID=1813537 RepID=A0ABQ7LEZ5_BRACM|nr:hypothetical protein IGI04_036628 [Brassica rapa subsp. trilocularis]
MDWWLSVEMTPTPMLASLLKTSDEIAKLFQTRQGLYGQPSVSVVPDQSAASSGQKLKIGVVLSEGQAPGGHNVISLVRSV